MASTQPMQRDPLTRKPVPGTKWRTFISLKGHDRLTKIHDSKREGEEWGIQTEAKMLSGVGVDFKSEQETTLRAIFDWYMKEAAPDRKPASEKWECNVLRRLSREPWADLTLDRHMEISQALRNYLKRRQAGDKAVKGQSLNRELNLISGVYRKLAVKTGFIPTNPIKGRIERPATKDVRDYKVWSPEALQLWLEHLDFDAEKIPAKTSDYIGWAILLLNTTGLRPVSLFATQPEWIDLDEEEIRYPAEYIKNAEAFNCGLNDEALPLVAKLLQHREGKWRLIPVTYGAIAQHYSEERAKLAEKHPELGELCLYGHRHTFTSENIGMFDSLAEAMKYMGRKSVKSLLRYMQTPTKLANAKFNAKRAAVRAGFAKTTVHSLEGIKS